MDKSRVELAKANELCHTANKLGSWPSKQKIVLWHCGPIAIGADVNPNKFEARGKKVALAKVQG
jgi:hypothetical protein